MFDWDNQCKKCDEFKGSKNIVSCNDCGNNYCLECLDENCDFCPECGKDLTEQAQKMRES